MDNDHPEQVAVYLEAIKDCRKKRVAAFHSMPRDQRLPPAPDFMQVGDPVKDLKRPPGPMDRLAVIEDDLQRLEDVTDKAHEAWGDEFEQLKAEVKSISARVHKLERGDGAYYARPVSVQPVAPPRPLIGWFGKLMIFFVTMSTLGGGLTIAMLYALHLWGPR